MYGLSKFHVHRFICSRCRVDASSRRTRNYVITLTVIGKWHLLFHQLRPTWVCSEKVSRLLLVQGGRQCLCLSLCARGRGRGCGCGCGCGLSTGSLMVGQSELDRRVVSGFRVDSPPMGQVAVPTAQYRVTVRSLVSSLYSLLLAASGPQVRAAVKRISRSPFTLLSLCNVGGCWLADGGWWMVDGRWWLFCKYTIASVTLLP